MKILDHQQNSHEWLEARAGIATASEFSKILTPAGRLSKQADGYIRKLVRECIIPIDPLEVFENRYTRWGKDYEPVALDWYASETGLDVREVGLCVMDGYPLGCSPDGLIYEEDRLIAGLEIKCKQADNHVAMIMDDVLPAEHALQVHGSMVVTGLNQWVFLGYYPGLKPFVKIIERDDFTAKVEAAMMDFVAEYKKQHKVIAGRILG